jgi:hypothetical protein
LGAGLHFLLEEVRFHGLHVGPVDVDQGGRALRFIVVDSTYRRGATIRVLIVFRLVETSKLEYSRLSHVSAAHWIWGS